MLGISSDLLPLLCSSPAWFIKMSKFFDKISKHLTIPLYLHDSDRVPDNSVWAWWPVVRATVRPQDEGVATELPTAQRWLRLMEQEKSQNGTENSTNNTLVSTWKNTQNKTQTSHQTTSTCFSSEHYQFFPGEFQQGQIFSREFQNT